MRSLYLSDIDKKQRTAIKYALLYTESNNNQVCYELTKHL